MSAKRANIVAKRDVCEDWRKRICDDCEFGTWNTWTEWNFDPDGKPITLRCPHYKKGQFGILRGSPACHLFAERKPTSV